MVGSSSSSVDSNQDLKASRTKGTWHALADDLRFTGADHTRFFLIICILAQAISLWMTWPLWQARTLPPNLPLIDFLPELSMGWPLIASLAIAVWRPQLGVALHCLLLIFACLLDQLRIQPQHLCLAGLACLVTYRSWQWSSCWFLGTLWLWTGIHKMLSPDWHGEQSWSVSSLLVDQPADLYRVVAIVVPLYEMILGVLAFVWPHRAVWLCVPMHLGIVWLLSPAMAAWNYEVIPWNLAMASVGAWLLFRSSVDDKQRIDGKRRLGNRWVLLAYLLVYPLGFYMGWVDHYLACVLYSDNLPRGLITTTSGPVEINSPELYSAFPYERRLFKQYFARVAQPGWKLHIDDPRTWLGDEYWLKTVTGLQQLTEGQFVGKDSTQMTQVVGILNDDRRAVFQLAIAGARLLKREERAMIYAVEIKPYKFRPELLDYLAGLPNLEQLQLRGCAVDDTMLERLPVMPNLNAIGLEGTRVTATGMKRLSKHPRLNVARQN